MDTPLSPNDFEVTAKAIAADLKILTADAAISVASMAIELRQDIKSARARGCSFRQIATIFASHGIAAEPDAIRIALNRGVVTKAARARKTQIGPLIPADTAQHVADEKQRETPHVATPLKRGQPNIAPRLK